MPARRSLSCACHYGCQRCGRDTRLRACSPSETSESARRVGSCHGGPLRSRLGRALARVESVARRLTEREWLTARLPLEWPPRADDLLSSCGLGAPLWRRNASNAGWPPFSPLMSRLLAPNGRGRGGYARAPEDASPRAGRSEDQQA